MAASSTFSDYRAVLTLRGARLPVLASAIGRLPIAMFSMATLLYVQRTTGSFAAAGLVSAGTLVGVALGSVGQGRIVDRLGPARPLLVAALAFAVAAGALLWAIETRQHVAVLVALAVLVGLTQPALPGASRALWGVLVPPGPRRDAAYAYEAISLEVFFILGPALAAFLVAAPWPGTGLVVAVLGLVLGTVGFALSPTARRQEVAPVAEGAGMLGAIARPGMRTVAVASLGFGLVVGAVEVGVPAVTTAAGSATLGGVLLSVWSIASVLAGVLYSLRPWPRPLHLRLPVLLAGFGAMGAVMAATALASSLVPLVVAMLVAGALITPQVTAHSLAVEVAAPAGAATEGFGWVITAATLGIAAGSSIAGIAVEQAGPPAAFLAGGVAGVALAALLWVRRGSLVAEPAPAAA
ncbi:MFS transporter [Pseudonocardia sp. CA-107938]|uniref:MFS transporter n=1 Tax=Pseudonocardia sp. CA-107938 TaxID=3240021 RepID=UPI003D946C6F